MLAGDHRSGVWMKGLLSECVRQKSSAEITVRQMSHCLDRLKSFRKQESKNYTVLQLTQMTVMMVGEQKIMSPTDLH